jgi:hypothetical protein
MAVIKWLIKGYLFGHICIPIFFPLIYIFPFFNAVNCIGGVILFIHLCRTGRLVLSKRVFFLLPHLMLFGLLHNDFSPFEHGFINGSFIDVLVPVFFIIYEFGLPFLLYCFLQVTEGYRAVAARIFCFILPGLMLIELIAIVPQ